MASTPLHDLQTPFLGWGPDDGVGFIGAGGLYGDDGVLKVARTCGTGIRAAASPSTGSLYGLLGNDGRICVYEGTTAAAVTEIRAHASAVAMANAWVLDAAGVGSTAPYLAYAHGSTAVAVDARSGKKRWSRDPDLGALTSAAASDLGGIFAFGGERGAAVLHGGTGRLLRAMTTSGRNGDDPVHAVALDTDGKRLATGQGGGRVRLWDTATGAATQTLDFGTGDVVDVSFSRDGTALTAVSRIAAPPAPAGTPTAGDRLEFEVWSLVEDMPLFRESVPAPPVTGPSPRLRIAPWGRSLIGSDGVGFTRVWQRPEGLNMPRGRSLREIPHHRPARGPVSAVVLASVADATGDTLTPTGLMPAVEGRTRLCEDATGQSVWVDAATRKDLAVVGPDGKVRVRHALARPARAASLQGDHLLVVADDGSVHATSRTGAALSTLKDITTAATVATGTGAAFVWGSTSGDVTFTGGGETPRVYSVHAGPVVALATSADGQTAVSVGPRVHDPLATDTVPTLGVSVLLRDPSTRGALASDVLGGSEGFSWVVDGSTATVAIGGSAPGTDDLALVRTDLETVVLDLKAGGRRLTLPWVARDAAFASLPATTPGGPGIVGVRWIDPTGHERHAPVAGTAEAERPRGRLLCENADHTSVASVDGDVLTLWNGHEALQGRSLAPTGVPLVGCAFNDAGSKVAYLEQNGRFEVWTADSGQALAGASGQATTDPFFAFAPVIDELAGIVKSPPPGSKADRARQFLNEGELTSGVAAPGSAWVRKDETHLAQYGLADGKLVETVEIPAGVHAIAARAGRFATLSGADGKPLGYVDLAAGPSRAIGRRVWAADTQPVAAHHDNYVWLKDGQLVIGPPAGPSLASKSPVGTPLAGAITPDGKLLAIVDDQNRVAFLSLPWRTVSMVAAGNPAGSPEPAPATERIWFNGPYLYGRDVTGAIRSWPWMASAGGAGGDFAAQSPDQVVAVAGIHALVASPDGRTLYSAQEDNLVRGWDIERAVQRTAFMGPVAPVHALAASGDGQLLAVGSADGTVRVFDTVTKVDERAFLTFGESTEALAFRREDGHSRVASLSDRGTLRAWDMTSGKALAHWIISPFSLGSGGIGLDWLPGLSRLTVTLAGLDWRVDLGQDGAAGGEAAVREAPPSFLGDVVTWTRLKAGKLASADAQGHISLWDEAAQLPYARLTMLSDGGWIADRIDGVQVASQTLRDASGPLLYGHGGSMEPKTQEKMAALVADSLVEALPQTQACLAEAPVAAAGSTVTLGWTVTAGIARNLTVTGNTTGSDPLAGCLVDVIQGLRYDLDVELQHSEATWVVAGPGAVRALTLAGGGGAGTDEAGIAAVQAALEARLGKAPKACAQKGVAGQARMAWRVEAGEVVDITVLDGSDVPDTVGTCVATAVKGARVDKVDRAGGVWVRRF